MELINPFLDNNQGGSWRSSGRDTNSTPTPAAMNSVYAINASPQVRQVEHIPKMPKTGQTVTITAKVTDPEGIENVTLSCQIVEPGQYIRKTDPEYELNWIKIPMNDLGLNGDAKAGDDVFTAQIPAAAQVHRRLIRYRIEAMDKMGVKGSAPHKDDPQPNFAYFCSDGVPAWYGAVVPLETPVLHFPADLMENGLPIYRLIAQSNDVERCQYDYTYQQQRFPGTLVYEGEVYDHIEFRVRGEGSTYTSGKNKWRFYFNRGHRFAARDNYGRDYNQKAHMINLSACASPYIPANRGMAGLEEAVSFRLFQLAGVPSSNTHWLQLRVIDTPEEMAPADPYAGDLWGLYLYEERTDGQFLKEHGYPDGDVYMMNQGNTLLANKINQSRDRPLDSEDWYRFDGDSQGHFGEDWWRQNLDLETYYSFHAINRAINNFDLNFDINYCFYRNPSGLWLPIPWDLDAVFLAGYHYPAVIPQTACLEHESLRIECKNRCRELLDLLFSDPGDHGGQACQAVEELASIVNPQGQPLTFVDVDEALWNFNPKTTESHLRQFYVHPATHPLDSHKVTRTLASADHERFERYMKDFMTDTDTNPWSLGDGDQRGYGYNYLRSEAEYANQPAKPSIRYTGTADYPIDHLTFASSSFDPGPPGNDTHLTGIKWRLAEISNPSTPLFFQNQPWKYEITPVWETELPSFQGEINIPPGSMAPGHTYRVRVKMKNGAGAWSHWSDPIQFVPARKAAMVVINEWMADNQQTLVNPDTGRFDDWFELYNLSGIAVDLSGFHLTDDLSQSNRWAIPEGTILAPYGYLLVWADGQPQLNRPGEALHAGFQLSSSGEAIGLFAPDGQAMDTVEFGRQSADTAQGRWPDGKSGVFDVQSPTPGTGNQISSSYFTLRIVSWKRLSNGRIALTWNTIPGYTYQLQYKRSLRASAWNVFGTFTANAAQESAILTLSAAGNYLFRIALVE
jgi:hypothetical protein